MTIVGNLTKDPELRFTAQGQAVCGFTIASTPRYMDKQTNQWKDGETLFMRCTAWGKFGENCAESLQRGMRVIVQGRLKQNNWEKDGVKHTSYQLEVDEVGPSLKFATAKVNRADRQSSSGGIADDPWASAAPRQPAGVGAQGGGWGSADNTTDQPPF